jgi:hypothetical protein
MTETDLSDWLPVREAAQVLGCSTRTVERLARAKKLEQRLRHQAGTPPVALYNPDDVRRLASERQPAPPPFVLDAVPPGNGNGKGPGLLASNKPVRVSTELLRAEDDPVRQFFAAALQAFRSPPSPTVSASVSETLWLTLPDASALAGLPAVDLKRACDAGELKYRKTGRGGYRIHRDELKAFR